LFDRAGRRDLVASSALFAVAVLTRETTALFVVVCTGILLIRDRYPRRALLFALGALGPYIVYRRLLKLWLGHAGVPSVLLPTHTPFTGIAHYWPWDSSMVQQVYAIVIPGVFCLVLAVVLLARRRFELAVWALGANALIFVVLLPYPVFEDIFASSRVTTGVVMSFVLAIPVFWTIRPALRFLVWLPVVAWMAPWTTLYEPNWFPYGAVSHHAVDALAVSIQGAPATASYDQEVNFTVWSTNSSPTTGFGPVVLTIYLPSGLKLVGPPFHERGSGCKGSEPLTCDLFSLSPQTGTPVRFGARLTEATDQKLSVSLSAPGAVTRNASFTVDAG
jgi:hypothetical protein